MRRSTPCRLRRIAPIGLVGFALAGTPGVAAASSCAADTGTTETMSLAVIREDTRCLLNLERASRDLPSLRFDRRLTGTARGHSRKMVAKTFFAHDSRSGRHFDERIAATGWMDDRTSWIVGENLAWGTGARATPHATVQAWMDSPAHRRNILKPQFRVIGIGVRRGTPIDGVTQGMTYTTDFGSR